MPEFENKNNASFNTDLVVGRNAVTEALRSGREIDKVFIAAGEVTGPLVPIVQKCKAAKILVKAVPPKKLDYLCGGLNHQGVIAVVAAHAYCTLEEILALAESRGEKPFIMICDCIEDPHNLGAIIRTAEATGVHGIVIPKHHSASLNATVAKSASGALEYMKVCKVTNLAATIDWLKERGVWVYGADMNGDCWNKGDYTAATALVIGSEGNGISRLVREKCDGIISLPMYGKINSLNASVAAGVLMYEVARQRA